MSKAQELVVAQTLRSLGGPRHWTHAMQDRAAAKMRRARPCSNPLCTGCTNPDRIEGFRSSLKNYWARYALLR